MSLVISVKRWFTTFKKNYINKTLGSDDNKSCETLRPATCSPDVDISQDALSKKVWTNPIYFLAFGFGSGLARFAPGTFGTIAAIPIYLLIDNFSKPAYLITVLCLFIIGVFICSYVSKDLKVDDYKGIVFDEIVGYLCVMFLMPTTYLSMLLGFILFRIFDIWKPEPIRYFDKKFKNGFGVMFDDLIAAIFAWIFMWPLILGL
jgi:phosphatidylglycerophosphatase A